MKRFILLFLTVLTLACLLTACADKKPSDKEDPKTEPNTVQTPEETEPAKGPKRRLEIEADYLYGSGMSNCYNSENDPDGPYSGVEVTQINYGIQFGKRFTETMSNLLYNSREDYVWTLHVSSYADRSDVKDYVMTPVSRFSTSYAAVYQFEPCLADTPFVPNKDRVYYIDLTIETDKAIYDITGSADGYVLNEMPAGGSYVEDGITKITTGPHVTDTATGWENMKAPTDSAEQTHLSIRVYGDGTAAYKNDVWQITLDYFGGTAKTITLVPTSTASFAHGTVYRFQTCLGEGENKFVPRQDEDYSVSVQIYQNNKLIAESNRSTDGFIPVEKAIHEIKVDPNDMPDPTKTALPIIVIVTEDGGPVPTNKSEVSCAVSLGSTNADYCAQSLAATIRCRGNGSMSVGKKTGKFPYKLKFDKKINPFGLGDDKEKDWVLLAHVGDQSMLRNYAAKRLGDLLSGIPYSTNCMLVNVYLNGEYIGVYELCEQVEVKDSRVNVNDTVTDKEIGFLLELDAYASGQYVRAGGMRFGVKSDITTAEQLDFIQSYIDKVHAAILGGNPEALALLVDMDSLVDMYLVHEFAKNIDAGWSSFYMYRDIGGKLYFAPPWDFDLAFGNDNRLDKGSYEGLYVGPGKDGFMQNHEWYNILFEYRWFRELAAQRWREISDTVIAELIEEVKNMAAFVKEDMDKNYERWDFLGEKQQQEPSAIYKLTTYKEHTDYLIQWMQNRKAWLDAEFSA